MSALVDQPTAQPTRAALASMPKSVVTLDQAVPADADGPGRPTACGLPACEGQTCRIEGCPPKRWLFAGLGGVCFAIAAAGVVLPVVPTTFPLMLSLMFFARSSVTLERRVREFGPFKPYIRFVDGSTPMPLRAKVVSCVLMWLPVSITAWLLFHSPVPDAAWIGTLSLAVIGTPVIFFWRPKLVG